MKIVGKLVEFVNLPKGRRSCRRAAQLGMTLIEIMLVVALLASLMAYLVSNIAGTADRAKEDQAKIAMSGPIANALNMYRIHTNKFPTTDKGLDALVTDTGDKKWRGPYIDAGKLKDPWDNEFDYESDGRSFKITSGGIDGQIGTEDDVMDLQIAP